MITAIYASILTFILIILVFRVVGLRRRNRVPLGDGGLAEMTAAIRSHGNFIETTPWALFLILLLELQHAHPASLHILGGLLVAGRLVHILALAKASIPLRVAGMISTLAVFAVGALYNLYLAS